MTEQLTTTDNVAKQDDPPPVEVELTPHQKWVRDRIEELYHRTTTLQSSHLDAGELERRMIRHEMALADLLVRVEKIAGWLKTRPWQKGGGE